MKRFIWRLQRILDLKVKQEDLKKTELLKITEKLILTQTELLGQERILAELLSEIAAKDVKSRLKDQEFFLKCSTSNRELINKLRERVKELESEQRKKINEIFQIRREKESLEKLRTKARQRYNKEQEKLEQNLIDESAAIAFIRSSGRPHTVQI
jgi:flagellar FliJ protein